MNIQIFGTSKCFDTKKAQRYFKERGIKFQMIDLKEKEMSRGEFENVARALGGWEQLVNPAARISRRWPCWMHWWIGRRRTSCSRISSSSKRPSCATAKRPPWATSPRSGKRGNKSRFHKKSTPRVLHRRAVCGILKAGISPKDDLI